MSPPSEDAPKRPRVLFLLSDTGGGHRAAARAIEAALSERAPHLECVLVDGLVEGATWPYNHSPAIYAWVMRHARWIWSSTFRLWNGPYRSRWMADLGFTPPVRRRHRAMIERADPDLVVSVHPLLTRSIARTLRWRPEPRPKLAIVVTDLITGHWSWFEPLADGLILPTEEALARAKKAGLEGPEITVCGQPIHPRCGAARAQREEIRAARGWDRPVGLLVGGGDGLGGLEKIVRHALERGVKGRLVVVCGRNERLRARLAELAHDRDLEVHGFVSDLHEMMAAADVLVTKGGPGTVMEGAAAGLPMILYDHLPGQEDGNVALVENAGAGLRLRGPRAVAEQLAAWLEDPAERAKVAEASLRLGVPDAADRCAQAILRLGGERLAPRD